MRPGGVGGDAGVGLGIHEPSKGSEHDGDGEVGGEEELFVNRLVGREPAEPGSAAEGGEGGDVGIERSVGEFSEKSIEEATVTVGALEDEGRRGGVGDDDGRQLAVGAEAAEDVEHRAGVFELHVLAGEGHFAAVMNEHGHLQPRGGAEEGDGAGVLGADVLIDGKPLDEDGAGGGEFFEHVGRGAMTLRAIGVQRSAEEVAIRAGHAQRADQGVGDVEVAADLTATLGRAKDVTGVVVVFVEGEKNEAIDAGRGGPVAVVDLFEDGVEGVAGGKTAGDSEPATDEEPGEAAKKARREIAIETGCAGRSVFFEGEARDRGGDAAGGVADMAVDVDDHSSR